MSVYVISIFKTKACWIYDFNISIDVTSCDYYKRTLLYSYVSIYDAFIKNYPTPIFYSDVSINSSTVFNDYSATINTYVAINCRIGYANYPIFYSDVSLNSSTFFND